MWLRSFFVGTTRNGHSAEYLLGMDFGLDLFRSKHALYDAVGTDDEGCAQCTHIFSAIHRLLAPHTHLFLQMLVGVGYQGERQRVFVNKLAVGCFGIAAYSHYGITLLIKLRQVIAQGASLGSTARGIVLRIEIEYQFAAGKITESEFLAILVATENQRCFIALLHIVDFK